jgi:hypothetical protein
MLPANSTLTNGTGTFSATLKTVGGQTITATDTATASITGTSNSINVTGAPATHFSVIAPANDTSGTSFSFTVSALDASNNLVTTYSGTVHFTSTDSQAVLPANSTLTNGTGSFSATLKTAVGGQTITATDTATASITGTSSSVNVSAAAATHFSVTAPATATTGTAFNFTVTPLDASNNVATSYSGTVHFTSTDGQAVLPGNSALANGTGSFSATLKTLGGQTITATDTATATMSGTSNSIDAGAPGPLTITSGTPPSGTVGAPYDVHSNGQQPPYGIQIMGFSLEATGGVPPYSWSWVAAQGSSLPPGLGIGYCFSSHDHVYCIGGTPSSAGIYKAVVTVGDSASTENQAAADYTVVIRNPQPPSINTTPAPSAGAVNLPYSFTFTATGGLPPFTWSETGALPPGLGPLSNGGVLSGTPTEVGSFPITVTAQDSLGQNTAPQDFTISVFLHGFKATGSMGTARTSHTATLLSNGKVLVTGGSAGGPPRDAPPGPPTLLATAELFDPTSGTFTGTGSMSIVRIGHTATLLNNGKVLVTGGSAGELTGNGPPTPDTLAEAELFDPTSGTFAPTKGNMETGRVYHTATLLNDGTVLVTGGVDSNNAVEASAELFDPTSGTFTPTTGKMSAARYGHTATLLNNGKVLVTGGGGNTAELYDPTSETFTPTTGSMETARLYHTSTLLKDGTVLVTGGVDSNNQAAATAELYDPTSETFTPTTGTMETVRSEHTATLLGDGTVLVAGGSGGTTAELYDPTSGTFAGTGSMQTPRSSHTATLLKDGTVLVTGGLNNYGSVLAEAELYQ